MYVYCFLTLSSLQVSSVVWNSEYRELVSGHGFTQNQLTVWKYPQMTKVSDLKGHTSRILLVVPSPDGTLVASAAGDETIRHGKMPDRAGSELMTRRFFR